jgi:hypothetical protein
VGDASKAAVFIYDVARKQCDQVSWGEGEATGVGASLVLVPSRTSEGDCTLAASQKLDESLNTYGHWRVLLRDRATGTTVASRTMYLQPVLSPAQDADGDGVPDLFCCSLDDGISNGLEFRLLSSHDGAKLRSGRFDLPDTGCCFGQNADVEVDPCGDFDGDGVPDHVCTLDCVCAEEDTVAVVSGASLKVLATLHVKDLRVPAKSSLGRPLTCPVVGVLDSDGRRTHAIAIGIDNGEGGILEPHLDAIVLVR